MEWTLSVDGGATGNSMERGSKLLIVNLMLVLVFSAGRVAAAAAAAAAASRPQDVQLTVVKQCAGPVLTIHSSGAEGIKYGFEGGRVVGLRGIYHLFTSEMVGDPHWVNMKLAHWTSRDRVHWKRAATLFTSTGDFTGKDPRAALWSPMPVYDPEAKRWNLFYVAYQASPDNDHEWLTNHEGRIWRAVSQRPGRDGINGPYEDVDVILERGRNSDAWEGLQGTDSFFPYQAGGRWYALYGSAHTEKLPLSLWQVGVASAPSLGGPWTRCTQFNPLQVEKRFIENPIVTRLANEGYLAVYDNHQPNAIGYAVSRDGMHWPPGRVLVVQSGSRIWASEVRTPLGLVEEGNGLFTLFYTANVSGGQTDGYGVTLTPGAVGYVEVRFSKTTDTAGGALERNSKSNVPRKGPVATDRRRGTGIDAVRRLPIGVLHRDWSGDSGKEGGMNGEYFEGFAEQLDRMFGAGAEKIFSSITISKKRMNLGVVQC